MKVNLLETEENLLETEVNLLETEENLLETEVNLLETEENLLETETCVLKMVVTLLMMRVNLLDQSLIANVLMEMTIGIPRNTQPNEAMRKTAPWTGAQINIPPSRVPLKRR
jgi:hypothetical protein